MVEFACFNGLSVFISCDSDWVADLRSVDSAEEAFRRSLTPPLNWSPSGQLAQQILYSCSHAYTIDLVHAVGRLNLFPCHLPFVNIRPFEFKSVSDDLSVEDCIRIYLLLRLTDWKQRPLATKLRYSEEFRDRLSLNCPVSQSTISRIVSRINEDYPSYANEITDVRRDVLLGAQDTEFADWFDDPPEVEFDGGKPDVKVISRKLRRYVYPYIKLNRRGNPQYKKDSLLKILACASRWGCQPNQAAKARELKPWNHFRDVPDASSLFYNIWPMTSEQVVEMFIVANEALFSLATEYTSFDNGVEVAIDITDWRTFADPDASTGISGTKPGRNSAHAWQYATLSVVGEHVPLTLAAVPVEKQSNSNIAVRRLLTYAAAKFDVERVYVDSGFYTTSVRKVFDDFDVDFVMKAKQHAEAIAELKDGAISMGDDYRSREWSVGDWSSTDYLWVMPSTKRSERRRSPPDHPRDDWTTFYTNLDPDEYGAAQLAAAYRQRWAIETGYRVLKYRFLPQSSSTEKHVRAFLVNYAALQYNMWQLSNLIAADWDESIDLSEGYEYEANYYLGSIVDDSRTIEVGEVGDLSNHSEVLDESPWF